jgi:hypothetical protein
LAVFFEGAAVFDDAVFDEDAFDEVAFDEVCFDGAAACFWGAASTPGGPSTIRASASSKTASRLRIRARRNLSVVRAFLPR